jgi:hypothetical protein
LGGDGINNDVIAVGEGNWKRNQELTFLAGSYDEDYGSGRDVLPLLK